MPTTIATAQQHQVHWSKIVRDPGLRDLPHKVETNARGQLVVSPHQNSPSFRQARVRDLLQEHAPDGAIVPEFAIATEQGVKGPDIIWTSPDRKEEMEATGDPTTLAPELCVEVMSDTNTDEEMAEKRVLYRDAGAEEVWIVDQEGQIRFFAAEEREHSALALDAPAHL